MRVNLATINQMRIIELAKAQDEPALRAFLDAGIVSVNCIVARETAVSLLASEPVVDRAALMLLLQCGGAVDQAAYGAAKGGHESLLAELLASGAKPSFAERGKIASGKGEAAINLAALISPERNTLEAAYYARGEWRAALCQQLKTCDSLSPSTTAAAFALAGDWEGVEELLSQHPRLDLREMHYYGGLYGLDYQTENKLVHERHKVIGLSMCGYQAQVVAMLRLRPPLQPHAIKGYARGGHYQWLFQALKAAETAKRCKYLEFALHGAVEAGDERLITALMEQGLAASAIPPVLVETNQGKLINALISTKVLSVDATDDEGNSLLHLAVAGENVELLKVLISLGATLELKNNTGLTAYQVAPIDGPSRQILHDELASRLIMLKLNQPMLTEGQQQQFEQYLAMYGRNRQAQASLSTRQFSLVRTMRCLRQSLACLPLALQAEIADTCGVTQGVSLDKNYQKMFGTIFMSQTTPTLFQTANTCQQQEGACTRPKMLG